MTNPKKDYPNRRRYDAGMIRDFIDHLKWELRIRHFENTCEPIGAVNPELVDMLRKYGTKRKCVGLIPANFVDVDGVEDSRRDELLGKWRRMTASETQADLDALESLEPLIDDAIYCLRKPNEFTARRIKLADIVDQLDESEDA